MTKFPSHRPYSPAVALAPLMLVLASSVPKPKQRISSTHRIP